MTNKATAICNKVYANINQPLSVYGLHLDSDSGYVTFTTSQPQADVVKIISKDTKKSVATLDKINDQGLFYKKLRRKSSFEYFLEI